MNDDPLNPSAGLAPKWKINFTGSYASLNRIIYQPIFDDDPDGLVIFGDNSTIYMAKVASGAAPYTKLSPMKAKEFFHGWALDAGDLYVLDGSELSVWNLGAAVKRESVQLLSGSEYENARYFWQQLRGAIQFNEWATLLEQAEDEYARQNPPQPEFRTMLSALRKMLGCNMDEADQARGRIELFRRRLNNTLRDAAPYCFSAPVVRPYAFQEPLASVFTIQGNGMLHAFDKQLGGAKKLNWGKTQADLYLALMDDRTTAPKRLAFVAESTLYTIDSHTLEPKGHWSPTTVPAARTTRSLTAANGQFWWSTDSGVYACKPDDTTLQLTWQTGAPWNPRQVGRMGAPNTNYNPAPDPNELFESMNVHAWIDQRQDKSVPLTDGMTAQLMLSDESGRYVAPPPNTTHVLYGPFAADATAVPHRWGPVKVHPTLPLVLLSDSNTTNMLSKYPSPCGLNQLLPQWAMSPGLSFVTKGSPLDVALSQRWPAPGVRQLSKPHPDMVAFLHHSPEDYVLFRFESVVPGYSRPPRTMKDRELRYVFWWAIFDHAFPDVNFHLDQDKAGRALRVFFTDAEIQALCTRFAGQGTVWDYWGRTQEHMDNFAAGNPVVNFDPPWLWKTRPVAPLFHKNPPAWYDPWGYNRPGDFVSQPQPTPTYLDPFTFDGHQRFPHRPITFDYAFKGHQWAVFTDDNPPVGTSSAVESEVTPEPNVFVIRTHEERSITNLYVLPAKRLGLTFDVTSHEMHPETLPNFAIIGEEMLGMPSVFLNTAWCVGTSQYPSARLHKLITVDPQTGETPFVTFVNKNIAQYGPTPPEKREWKTDKCPLPNEVLPSVILFGYALPAPH